eukprot:08335.XXX_196276_196380_1 [CDS] Oithona nana genome sequencing.
MLPAVNFRVFIVCLILLKARSYNSFTVDCWCIYV